MGAVLWPFDFFGRRERKAFHERFCSEVRRTGSDPRELFLKNILADSPEYWAKRRAYIKAVIEARDLREAMTVEF